MTDHGTYKVYSKMKCRCDECSSYQRNRVAKNRADRLANGRITHGTRSGYDAGCRCEKCGGLRRAITQRDNAKDAESQRATHNHSLKYRQEAGKCPACDKHLVRT